MKIVSHVGTVSRTPRFKYFELRPDKNQEKIHHLDSFTRLSCGEQYYKMRCSEKPDNLSQILILKWGPGGEFFFVRILNEYVGTFYMVEVQNVYISRNRDFLFELRIWKLHM